MGVELLALHWVYLLFILLIIGVMVMRRDTSLVCIIGIFVISVMTTGSLGKSVGSVFNSFIFAITELLSTILVICIIVAMSRVLTDSGINEVMIRPVARLIRSPGLAYWVIGILMMVISWFFWPSPGVALIGAVLLPVALRMGLPALGIAMAMNLFGHGIALSGDFVIQGAPTITSKAAGIPVGDVISASVPLVFVMGVVTTIVAFWFLRKDMKSGALTVDQNQLAELGNQQREAAGGYVKLMAVLVPILFLLDVIAMIMLDLKGGDATALLGGTAIFILILSTLLHYKENRLEKITQYMIQGFEFGFKVFGPVIPIAAFFYLGDSGFKEILGDYLPKESHGIVNDLGVALANSVPLSPAIGAVTLTTVGAITGLDGSGFSGVSLAGSIAKLFGTAIDASIATLTALGQIAAIWVGGGTLVPWALIPAAAICGVDPFELARRNLIPVVIGLLVTTLFAMFLI
ncbi:hypothetical protein [Effusibacillus lacus]|uniref:Transporter n=1 Tax=Effusibacillus lacus TaxID=1348429 RepID=A0A292YDA6_9BACL|nr:hypothetical protein [Effusibacillus lacus]TCS71432.1 hypothetical protein EDD64_12650 [Effusibacillus lacus]GAX89962.1 hypothetical protein EFBL_1588 [Effusibacillus lacus]